MPSYGGYETVSRIGHSPEAEAWTARPVGGEADALEHFVVKAYHPTRDPFESDEVNAARLAGLHQEFLGAAQVQAQVAQARPGRWAPVFGAGVAGEEAFHVTTYYGRSAEDLARAQLDTRTLHGVMASVVQGLIDLRDVAQRPHGNLKATNVLITRSADQSQTQGLLTDPLPGARIGDIQAAAVGDVRNLGIILHRLAVQRPPTAAGAAGAQLVPAAEGWERLGRKGQAWKQLCTQLLMTPQAVSLEALSAELAKLYEAPVRRGRIVLIAGGIAAAVAAAVVIYLLTRPRPPVEPVQPDSTGLDVVMSAYPRWFAALRDDMTRASGERAEEWLKKSAPLSTVAGLLKAALNRPDEKEYILDPRNIAIEAGAEYKEVTRPEQYTQWLRDWIESGTWREQQGKVRRFNERVGRLAGLILSVAGSLSPDGWRALGEFQAMEKRLEELSKELSAAEARGNRSECERIKEELARYPIEPSAEQGWAALRECRAMAAQWSNLGWRKPAAYVKETADAVKLDKYLSSSTDAFLQLANAPILTGVEKTRHSLEELHKKFSASGSKVLPKFLAWAQGQGRSELPKDVLSEAKGPGPADVQELSTALKEASDLGDNLARAVDDGDKKKLDWSRFLAESEVERLPDAAPTKQTFAGRWLEEAKLYYFLSPDPREQEKWEDQFKKIEGEIASLEKETPKAKAKAEAHRSVLKGEIKDKHDAMRKIVGIERDRHLVVQAVTQLRDALRELARRIERDKFEFFVSPKEWYDGIIRFGLGFRSPSLGKAWVRSPKGTILDKLKPEELAKDGAKYSAIRTKVEHWQELFELLDGDKGLARDLPKDAQALSSRPWYNPFLTRLTGRREQALGKVAERIPAVEDAPDLSGSEVGKAWDEAQQDFAKWREGVGKMVVEAGAIEDALNACYLLDDTLPGASAPLGAACQQLSQAPLLQSERELSEALKPVNDRVNRLRDLADVKERQRIADFALASNTREAAYAAWLALGQLGQAQGPAPTEPAWPASADEMRVEDTVRQHVASQLRGISDAARREKLRADVVRGGVERETRWLNGHLDALCKKTDSAGDAVVEQFSKYVLGQRTAAAKKSPDELLAELRKLKPLAEQISGVVGPDWQKKVDYPLFAKESSIHRDYTGGKAPAGEPKTYDRWLKEVSDYYRIPADDPVMRQHQDIAAREKDIEAVVEDLEKRGGQDEKQMAAELVAQLKSDVAPYRALPPISKNRAALQARLEAADKTLVTLRGKVKVYGEIIIAQNQAVALAAAIKTDGGKDKVLDTIDRAVETEKGPASAPPDDRLKRLMAILEFASPLADFVKADWAPGKIDRELFAQEGKVYTTLDPAKANRKTFDDWRTEAEAYRVVVIPADETPEALTSRIAQLRKTMDDRVQNKFATPEDARKLDDALAKVASQHLGRLASAKLPAIRKNAPERQRIVGEARDELSKAEKLIRPPEAPKVWHDRVRKVDKLVASEAVNAEWCKRRNHLLDKVYTVPLLEADMADKHVLYPQGRKGFEEMEAFFKQMDDQKAFPPPPAELEGGFLAEGAKAREAALATAMAAISPPLVFPRGTADEFKKSKGWLDAVAGYSDSLALIARVQREAAVLRRLLDAGYLPDDKPDKEPKTVREVLSGWDAAKVPAPRRQLAAPVEAIAQRIVKLEGLDRKQLVDMANAPGKDDPPQVPFQVWKGLGKQNDWPATMVELKTEAALRGQVAAIAAKIEAKGPHPVSWVKPELDKEGPPRWERCFNALVERLDPKGADDKELLAAIEIAKTFPVARSALKGMAQFRWLLCEFRQKVFIAPETTKKDELLKWLADFEKEAAALPDGYGKQAAVADLLKRLRDTLERSEEGGGASGLDKAGPALARWAAKPAPDGKSVEYTWTEKGKSLTFLRVDPRGGGRAAYLCTTEASLGLFIDVVTAGEKWPEANDLLGTEKLKDNDARQGPLSWEPRRKGTLQIIRPRAEWLKEDPAQPPYPEGLKVDPPKQEHPIQYVNFESAAYLARLLFCRLPTSAEWSGAALALGNKGTNLRDQMWRAELNHATKGGRIDRPDAGIFRAAGQKGGEGLVRDDKDEFLWFAPADPSPQLQHLVGNVAEFVFDDSALGDQLLKDPGGASANAVRGLAAKGAGRVKVVGGSALSPPELWDGKAKPFDTAYPAELKDAPWGFSDVGFRLAFTAPVDPPAMRLAMVLKEHGYLGKAR
ncbi:MAG: hypothetical protein FJ291_20565 [Planctomycetes bacterium]|nr:hypothetical protein [Planctomycetota bacterium]